MSTTTASPTTDPLRVVVLLGSTRRGRAGEAIASWFVCQARGRDDVVIDLVDLADTMLPVVLPDFDEQELPDAVTQLGERLAAADAFVVVTPEYNHSFPASLKNAIDWFHEEWFAKPAAFVSYGGRGQGIRAAEQLRQVFAELHVATTRNTVGIDLSDVDEDGWPVGAEGAAKVLLDELGWWGRALRAARRREPYAV